MPCYKAAQGRESLIPCPTRRLPPLKDPYPIEISFRCKRGGRGGSWAQHQYMFPENGKQSPQDTVHTSSASPNDGHRLDWRSRSSSGGHLALSCESCAAVIYPESRSETISGLSGLDFVMDACSVVLRQGGILELSQWQYGCPASGRYTLNFCNRGYGFNQSAQYTSTLQ